MMVGYINIVLMKYENNMALDYFTTLSSYYVMPYISTPARITDSSATLIDHIFVSRAILRCRVIPGLSMLVIDARLVFCETKE